METEREAYLWYMPGIFYEEGTTTPLITKLWTKIENWYPLGMYLKEHQGSGLLMELLFHA